VASLEMSDVGRGVKAFFRRMQPRQDLPTLHQKYRENIPGRGRSPGGRLTPPNNRRSPGRRRQQSPSQLSYEPPDFVAA
jgi:hypothetical protein